MSDFSFAISRWCDRAKGRATAVLRGTALEAVGRVQELTPVDTGFLRANWSAVLTVDAIPKPGAPTLEALATARAGDVIYIVNPTAYARAIEYGRTGERKDGTQWVMQGRGMAAQTVAELPQIADRVLKALTK
ncbi:HK97 gp10 family phage protein [Azospirillum sp. TSO5]|uniref:HK97 gp10 family phage protein n=1 Tax=Azospirillum sp. TSO5 TaxID=716760 RepID=UPI000D64884F|nr:HK97 gp10 family phage protein [Azospirillum sp. TSO5]